MARHKYCFQYKQTFIKIDLQNLIKKEHETLQYVKTIFKITLVWFVGNLYIEYRRWILLILRSPKGGCCSISDDLSCSHRNALSITQQYQVSIIIVFQKEIGLSCGKGKKFKAQGACDVSEVLFFRWTYSPSLVTYDHTYYKHCTYVSGTELRTNGQTQRRMDGRMIGLTLLDAPVGPFRLWARKGKSEGEGALRSLSE